MTTMLAPTTEHTDPFVLPPAELARRLAPVPWRRVVVMGDSVAAGVGDPVTGYRPMPWSDRLVEVLALTGSTITHRNLGVRGLRAVEIREQQLDAALAFDPDLVVLTAGGNDMLARSFDALRVEAEVDHMVRTLTGAGATVATFGLFDLTRTGMIPESVKGDLRSRTQQLNQVTRTVTARHGGVFVDYEAHPALSPAVLSADLIHANHRGHAAIATTLALALEERLLADTVA